MERDTQIETILDFVNRHPESLATRTIRRRVAVDLPPPNENARAVLEDRLQMVDEETLTGFYYLVK